MNRFQSYIHVIRDTFATLACWIYFTIGFIILFAPFYIYNYLFCDNKEYAYQRLNQKFYHLFFKLLRLVAPNFSIRLDGDIENISSSIIICNHISYLDPLFLISIYDKHKTIVKDKFFNVPIFGSVLKHSGYIPSSSHGKLAYLTIRQMENMKDFFDQGGNLFVFPEGTRSQPNHTAPFHSSAFKLAIRHSVPIYVLHITNTDNFFPPGKWLFNTSAADYISIELLGYISTDSSYEKSSVSDLMQKAHALLYTY